MNNKNNSAAKRRFQIAQDLNLDQSQYLKTEAKEEIIEKDGVVEIQDNEYTLIQAIIKLKLSISLLKFYEHTYKNKKFLLKDWKNLLK